MGQDANSNDGGTGTINHGQFITSSATTPSSGSGGLPYTTHDAEIYYNFEWGWFNYATATVNLTGYVYYAYSSSNSTYYFYNGFGHDFTQVFNDPPYVYNTSTTGPNILVVYSNYNPSWYNSYSPPSVFETSWTGNNVENNAGVNNFYPSDITVNGATVDQYVASQTWDLTASDGLNGVSDVFLFSMEMSANGQIHGSLSENQNMIINWELINTVIDTAGD